MAEYVLTNKADDDLDEIYVFSFHNFGEAKADEYLLALRDCFQALADSRLTGWSADEIQPGLRKYRHVRHVIFYSAEQGGVLIVRILHDAMDFPRHLDPGP